MTCVTDLDLLGKCVNMSPQDLGHVKIASAERETSIFTICRASEEVCGSAKLNVKNNDLAMRLGLWFSGITHA